MFVVEALANFSEAVMAERHQQNEVQTSQNQDKTDKLTGTEWKRSRPEGHEIELQEFEPEKSTRTHRQVGTHGEVGTHEEVNTHRQPQQPKQAQVETPEQASITYCWFKTGEKILVKETFENGWWYGHPVKEPQAAGFFPSNYVRTFQQPPPPKKETEEEAEHDQREGTEWIKKELDAIKTGPVNSQYYQGVKGYKLVKINENNQNILKGNHVQFDVATGLARVPVKDQAPTAKAVRQMGYYFDYHQWNQSRNAGQTAKARPDPRKKKAKKLRLKMMD